MSVSVRLRAAAFGAAVTFVAVLVFVGLMLLLVQVSTPEDRDRELDHLAAATAADLAVAAPERLAPSTPPVLLDPATSSDPFLVVFADDGTILYRTVAIDGRAPAIPTDVIVAGRQDGYLGTVELSGREVRLRAVPWSTAGGGAGGVVVAGQATAAVDETLSGLSTFLAVATSIALAFAFAVGWIVSGRALRPLRDLVGTIDEIGGTGDLSRRLPPNDTKDEVGRLTRSFNAMLDRLEASRRELASALEAQRRFVADASHELRSPLTTIRSNAGFLRERPDASPDDRAEAVADIEAEADRMADLVDDLLTLARGDEGLPSTAEVVDLAALAEDEARLLGSAERPVSVSAEGPALVAGDARALRRVVRILLDNALRHGRGAIRITISGEDRVVLRVVDEGPGFPDDDLDRVFDRFYRADPARRGPGAGLGLAIARSIVAGHGGSIAAANDPAGGAVVTVTVPGAPRRGP